MAATGLTVWLSLGAALFYTVWATITGRKSVSGYLKNAPRWIVATVGFGTGLAVGILFSHWWFPTTGV